MANRSIEKVLDILEYGFNDSLSKLTKEKRKEKKRRRVEYYNLLKNSKTIHVPKKIWKYIGDVGFLGELVKHDQAPVPFKNQTLLFQPSYRFGSKLLIEYIHVYKYNDSIEHLFPSPTDLKILKNAVPFNSFVPVGDIGIQICIRTTNEFPILISCIIVDYILFIHRGQSETCNWEVMTEEAMNGPHFVFGLMAAMGLNTLAFISEPEKAYVYKEKLLRLPKVSNRKKRQFNSPASWTKSKIKREHTVYMEPAEGEKGEYSEPEFQVEVPSHVRTLNYCSECEQFIPLRFIPKRFCPRCKAEPLRLEQKKSVVVNFMKWKNKPTRETQRDVFLSE